MTTKEKWQKAREKSIKSAKKQYNKMKKRRKAAGYKSDPFPAYKKGKK